MTPSTLLTAFDAIQRTPKYDHYGITVAAVKFTSSVLPDEMCNFFERICGSTLEFPKIIVGGVVLGKDSASSKASSMRAIMPLPFIASNH